MGVLVVGVQYEPYHLGLYSRPLILGNSQVTVPSPVKLGCLFGYRRVVER